MTPAAAQTSAMPVPAFSLVRFGGSESIALDQFAGHVVVLDFFAYWCAPCRQSSPVIEREIQRYYAERGGNPHGVPVRVISVNIDTTQPGRTGRFVRQTGMTLVADDPEGAALRAFGGTAIPFLVLVDARRPEAARIVYRRAGFEGVEALRAVIDSVGVDAPAEFVKPGMQRNHSITASGEVLWASDIQLGEATAEYRQEAGAWRSQVNLTYRVYAEEYRPFAPFDALGFAEDLREDSYSGQAEFSYQLAEPWRVLVSGGAYSGFPDYQTVWLDNYYKQQFSVVPEYEEADPQGFNAGVGGRWTYWPERGFLEARASYFHDQVAPGYEVDPGAPVFRLLRGRDELDTWSTYLAAETVLSARARSLLEFRATKTTDREWRLGFQGSWNVAVGEQGVLRCQAGYTWEEPELEAWFAGAGLEWELFPGWSLLASGRYYKDTGEIVNGQLLSSAAPGLSAWQLTGGIRYVGSRVSVRISVGPYFSRYEALDIGTRPFTNLYRDRDWILAQGAIGVQF